MIEDKLVSEVNTPLSRIAPSSIARKNVQFVVVLPADTLVTSQRWVARRLNTFPCKVAQIQGVQSILVAFLRIAAKKIQLPINNGTTRTGALQWNITAARLLLPKEMV